MKNSSRNTRLPAPSSSEGGSSSKAERHSSERYEIEDVARSQIEFADYNPRNISEQSRKKLKAAIEKVGLLGPVIWNKRTGRLVSGHQRLRSLDAIHRGKQYTLRVASVDLTDEEERSANILLNNPEAQGEWDFEKLGEMLKSPSLDLVAAGMGSADVYKIIGQDASDEVLADVAERIDATREIAGKTAAKADANSTDYYLVVVFRDYADRLTFTEAAGMDDNRYVSGEDLAASMNIELSRPSSSGSTTQ